MIDRYIETIEDHILISDATPLISNLNMKENIALIREVHHKTPRLEAESEAQKALEKISLGRIGSKRQNECSKLEIFYVMLVRALFSDPKTVVIKRPFSLVDSLLVIDRIIDNTALLNREKAIIILDTKTNYSRYKDCKCNITK